MIQLAAFGSSTIEHGNATFVASPVLNSPRRFFGKMAA